MDDALDQAAPMGQRNRHKGRNQQGKGDAGSDADGPVGPAFAGIDRCQMLLQRPDPALHLIVIYALCKPRAGL